MNGLYMSRNLVIVIVIETFENIPQQQTTSSGTKPRRHTPAVIILNSGGTAPNPTQAERCQNPSRMIHPSHSSGTKPRRHTPAVIILNSGGTAPNPTQAERCQNPSRMIHPSHSSGTKPRRHTPAVIILNSSGTPLPVEWNQNGRNTPPPLKYIERNGANRSRKFYASTKANSSLTHQQTTTIDQVIPETL
ncbi:uncharacterized protein LOC143914009 [Arctopsyche grandis]|uniref:uncharacterized protein LOC143914009 n=1 Tax=Arctopsyche grandis TaxID=121162 RepID=UPI00406D8A69